MSLSASEFFEAGLALPPSVRKDVALRLLDSIEVVDDTVIEAAWSAEITSRIDDIVSGRVQPVPGDEVFTQIVERRAAQQAALNV